MMVLSHEGALIVAACAFTAGVMLTVTIRSAADYLRGRRRRADVCPYADPNNWG